METVSTLLLNGGNSKLQDYQGNTALHLSCGLPDNHVYPIAADALILNDSSILTTRNQDSLIPLHIAAERGHFSIIKVLISKMLKENIDLTITDKNGRNAAHWAALSGSHETDNIIMHFIQNDPEFITSVDNFGRSIVHCVAFAPQISRSKFVKKICEDENYDIDCTDKVGNTALHWAAFLLNADFLSQMLFLGADPNVLNLANQTCLDVFEEKQSEYISFDTSKNSKSSQQSRYDQISQILRDNHALTYQNILNLSATRIQARVRGWLLRKSSPLAKKRSVSKPLDINDAINRITSSKRNFSKRRQQQATIIRKRINAATVIQRWWRQQINEGNELKDRVMISPYVTFRS